MGRLLLRFGPLLVAAVFVLMSYRSWTFGDPPTWTVFGPRSEARVVSSQVVVGRAGNGTIRHEPEVNVAWPSDATEAVALGNLKPSFYAYGADHAAEIAATFVVGETITVRVHDGRPHADVIDWFGLLHAAFISAFSLVIAAIAVLFLMMFGPGVRRSGNPHPPARWHR
jgi:hypothetical protein